MKKPATSPVKTAVKNRKLYTHIRTIRFGDTDAAAIVYTPNFTNYCMEAAENWFKQYLDVDWYTLNTDHGMGTPIVHMEIDFFAPLIGSDQLGTCVEVEKVSNSTITLNFRGEKISKDQDDNVHCFNAKFVFCFTSIKAGGAIPIPQHQLKLLEKYKIEGALVTH